MAKQTINIGTTPNDGTGDALRNAFDKTNSNFTELYDGKQDELVSGTNIKTVNGNSLLGSGDLVVGGSSGITVGTTSVTSGTVGRVFFEGSGNVVQQDSALFWDNTNKRFGVGATPATNVTLDVRAQGALSTDIAFRVRNSADSDNLFSVNGIGNLSLRASSGTEPFTIHHSGTLQAKLEVASNAGLLRIYNAGVLRHDIDGRDYARFKGIKITEAGVGFNYLNIQGGTNARVNVDIAGDPIFDIYNSSNLNVLRIDSRSGEGALQIKTTGTPSTSITDGFKQYSADIVAGNAAPHFRTENGNIIKLYQQSSAGITTVGQLVTVLQNLGLLS